MTLDALAEILRAALNKGELAVCRYDEDLSRFEPLDEDILTDILEELVSTLNDAEEAGGDVNEFDEEAKTQEYPPHVADAVRVMSLTIGVG